jgi:hypothetical protein
MLPQRGYTNLTLTRAAAAAAASAYSSASKRTTDMLPDRMFALVHLFVDAVDADRAIMTQMRLVRHAIRRPQPPLPPAAAGGPNRPPFIVVQVSDILRAARKAPPKWSVHDSSNLFNVTADNAADCAATRQNKLCIQDAACKTGSVLLYIEPRGTWLPGPVLPADIEGINAALEEEADDEEGEEVEQ